MKKRMTAALALVLTLSLVLSGCVIGKLTSALRDEASKAASSLQDDLSSAASEISSGISEAVSDVSENVSEALSETEKETSEAPESGSEEETESETPEETTTETESESESETTTETEPKPSKAEKPTVLHLLQYETSRYNSTTEDDSYRTLCQMKMDDISLMRDDDLSLYPELLETLEKKKLENWKEFESLHEDLLSAAKSTKGVQSSYNTSLKLARSDSAVLSFAVEKEYFYAGTMRPWRETVVTNLSAKTGKELALSDFVSDTNGLIQKLHEEVEAYILKETENEDAVNQADYFFEDIEPEEMRFTVDYDRISFWFDAGDILPNAFSNFRIDVLFAGNEALFTDLALNVPEKYITEIPARAEQPYLLSDGRTLAVSPIWNSEYEDWFEIMQVTLGDSTEEFDFSGISISRIYQMHLQEAGDFLYVVCDDYNGWATTVIYNINGAAPVCVGSRSEGVEGFTEYEGDYGDEESTGYTTREILTDPMHFMMGTPIHLLSSYFGYRSCEAGEDGMPVPTEYWYMPSVNRTLTLLQDLEVDVTTEDGETTGKLQLKKDDQVTICGANPEDRRVLLYIEDGTLISVQCIYDETIWRETVNGISIDDLFDGMMFAG